MHTGGPETNRANKIQMEICAEVADIPRWAEVRYKAVANVIRLYNETVPRGQKPNVLNALLRVK